MLEQEKIRREDLYIKTNVNIKLDEDICDEVKALLCPMGLDMMAVVNMFFFATLRKQGLPFSVIAVAKCDTDEGIKQLLLVNFV